NPERRAGGFEVNFLWISRAKSGHHPLRNVARGSLLKMGPPPAIRRQTQNTCLTLSVFSVASCSKPFIFEQEITEGTERANREGVFEGGASHRLHTMRFRSSHFSTCHDDVAF